MTTSQVAVHQFKRVSICPILLCIQDSKDLGFLRGLPNSLWLIAARSQLLALSVGFFQALDSEIKRSKMNSSLLMTRSEAMLSLLGMPTASGPWEALISLLHPSLPLPGLANSCSSCKVSITALFTKGGHLWPSNLNEEPWMYSLTPLRRFFQFLIRYAFVWPTICLMSVSTRLYAP